MRLQKEVLGQFLETVDSIICQFRQGGQNLRSGAWKNKWGISGVCSRPRKVAQETSQRWGGMEHSRGSKPKEVWGAPPSLPA